VFPLQLSGFAPLLSLLLFAVWAAVVVAVFDIRRATKRTATVTERIADRLDAMDDDEVHEATDDGTREATDDDATDDYATDG